MELFLKKLVSFLEMVVGIVLLVFIFAQIPNYDFGVILSFYLVYIGAICVGYILGRIAGYKNISFKTTLFGLIIAPLYFYYQIFKHRSELRESKATQEGENQKENQNEQKEQKPVRSSGVGTQQQKQRDEGVDQRKKEAVPTAQRALKSYMGGFHLPEYYGQGDVRWSVMPKVEVNGSFIFVRDGGTVEFDLTGLDERCEPDLQDIQEFTRKTQELLEETIRGALEQVREEYQGYDNHFSIQFIRGTQYKIVKNY